METETLYQQHKDSLEEETLRHDDDDDDHSASRPPEEHDTAGAGSQSNGKETLDVNVKEKLDVNVKEKLDVNGKEKLDINVKEKLDVNVKEKLDVNVKEKLDVNVKEKLDVNGKEKLDVNVKEKLDVNGQKKLDVNVKEKLDVNGQKKLDVNVKEKLDVTGKEKLDVTGKEKLGVTGKEKLGVNVKEKLDVNGQKLLKKTNSWKMVRFQEPSTGDDVLERDSCAESLFPLYDVMEWTNTTFKHLFRAEDWKNITDDQLLRKKVLDSGDSQAPPPTWGQEVTVRMQCVREDRNVVEKDSKLVFVIGDGDVNQALEQCVLSMQKDEITLLLADSQYTYGLLGRDPDVPPWAPLLYQLQLLEIKDKPDVRSLCTADRIRIGNQKRERGNFHYQREEYTHAVRAYCKALGVLSVRGRGGSDGREEAKEEEEEEEEVRDYRVKCLNNLATAQLKLELFEEALLTSRDVLSLQPNNVKALFRAGKLLSDKTEYREAMELLKKALKLEPTTKAIHAELSRLVRRQTGGKDPGDDRRSKAEEMLGGHRTPSIITSQKQQQTGISWRFILVALMVALGSLVTSVILTARN